MKKARIFTIRLSSHLKMTQVVFYARFLHPLSYFGIMGQGHFPFSTLKTFYFTLIYLLCDFPNNITAPLPRRQLPSA